MKVRTLRARLLLAYIGLIVLGFGSVALVAGQQLAQGVVEEFERNLATQSVLVARGLSEVMEHDRAAGRDVAKLEQVTKDFATNLNARVVVINDHGQVWLDSAGLFPKGDQRHLSEVGAAFAGVITYNVRRDEDHKATVHAAAPMSDAGKVFGVVQLTAPLAATEPHIWRRWLALGLGVLALTIAALGVALWLASSLTRPLAQLRIMALQIAAGDLSHRVALRGNDEITQVAAAFNHMATQVQAMLDEQRAFASNASHELRTPLTTIRIRSEALRNNCPTQSNLDDVTQQRYIAEIDDEARHLSNLIEDLIILSRFDAGRVELSEEEVDVVRLTKVLLREFTPVAETRQLQLTLDAPAELPPLTANSTHVRVVLRNILDNAIKYTPDGGWITWRLWGEGRFLHMEIRDNGRGIDPAVLPQLFKRFYRGDLAHTRATPGVGLGLALTQSILHFYGGQIEITSPGLGQGSTVHIQWPQHPVTAHPPQLLAATP
ncbi:MAG: ATP-binding protein [Caldilineaceae bacterium]